MNAVCPVCQAPQDQGLACHDCVSRLEKDLAEVRALMTDLDISTSKQARIGGGSGKAGPPHERTPINWNAAAVAEDLTNTLTTWARDVTGNDPVIWAPKRNPMKTAAAMLLSHIDAIRRHPAVVELVDEITDAITQARRAIDRPADRQYLGQCLMENPDENGRQVTCLAELYARHGASEVRCSVCGTEHPVAERRAWLMKRAEDMIVTVKEASSYLGEVGEITISQASIRSYVHRQKLAYRAPVEAKRFRLGDLLAVVLDESERKGAA